VVCSEIEKERLAKSKKKESPYRAKRAVDYVARGAYDAGEIVVTTSLYDMFKVLGTAFDPDYTWQEYLMYGDQCEITPDTLWARESSVLKFEYGVSEPLVTYPTR